MQRDQILHHGGRIIGTELVLPNFPELASAFGIYGRRVTQPAELEAAVREAVAQDGPALLDVACPVEGI
jgi:thiamine pyrophosphate-dependent acetolactate synthase large subunit-like protein